MAGRGADHIPAPARPALPRPPHRPAAPHPEALGRHAAHRAGAVARRPRHRLLQRAEIVLRGPLSRGCRDRSGETAAHQGDVDQQLRELAVHQLRGIILAGRALLRDRREAQRQRRPRHPRRQEGRGGASHHGAPERVDHAELVARRQADRVHGVRRWAVRPVRCECRRQRLAPPHQRQVRRSPPLLVPGRQDHRVRDRPRPGDRLQYTDLRQHANRPVPLGQRGDRPAPSHGARQEHQPAVGARRAIDRLRLGSDGDQRRLPLRPGRPQPLSADRPLHRCRRVHAALPRTVVGAAGGPDGVRLLRGG